MDVVFFKLNKDNFDRSSLYSECKDTKNIIRWFKISKYEI
jgi:hypothetical protein